MNRSTVLGLVVCLMIVLLAGWCVSATNAQMYFSSDKNGQNRVTNVQEGDEIWIAVIDNDENIDCDIRDKIWPDLKVYDNKTGAYAVWDPDPAGDLGSDYLEETGADTGVFVSKRAFQVGTRLSYSAGNPHQHTHVVDVPVDNVVDDFMWGHGGFFTDIDEGDAWAGVVNAYPDNGGQWVGPAAGTNPMPDFGLPDPGDVPERPDVVLGEDEYLIGRFENMDTLIGMYQDPNDATDVAVAMMKIIDTEAAIAWGQEIYKDANTAATITVIDPDENLNCNQVEYVPVFIIVNPGSWNPVDDPLSATNFCMLKRIGGVCGNCGSVAEAAPMRWYNIYNAHANAADPIGTATHDGRYYLEYPTQDDGNVTFFDTTDVDGLTPVSFYAQETGVNTGVFQLNLNSILDDLEFNQLLVRDVLVAYYLDPNDFDDFKIATAYIEERQHSITSFTDANRAEQDLYWIGRDPVYVQVIDSNANVDPCCPEQVVVHVCDPHGEDDSEWLILDETSSNSPTFFTFAGTQLWPVWDALGVGFADSVGGFQLQLDNWKLEVFNEDDLYARYNDVYYEQGDGGLAELGDSQWADGALDGFPPVINRTRVANDVSFDLMSIADTQVYDGDTTNMWFLDRQGNRVSGYVNSDCVFIEVLDPDQDEDQRRRERVNSYAHGGQDLPFGPISIRPFECELDPRQEHPINPLFGDTNIFNDEPVEGDSTTALYILNPRSGFWAAVDLLETGVATGDFVSVICIDLVDVYECVPALGALPGDTIVAFYRDPSNLSDNAMISIKVGIGGGGTPPSQQSTTMFVDVGGNEVANYNDADTVYVKVIDPSHAAGSLTGALTVEGSAFDLMAVDGEPGVFVTAGLNLGLVAGTTIEAEYTDPTDQTDTSEDTITIIAGVLSIDEFYAGPNPFDTEVTFGYVGTGIATTLAVAVYDLAGRLVWESTQTDVSEIVWDGTEASGSPLANGCYIYVITATDGTNTFTGNGKVFVAR